MLLLLSHDLSHTHSLFLSPRPPLPLPRWQMVMGRGGWLVLPSIPLAPRFCEGQSAVLLLERALVHRDSLTKAVVLIIASALIDGQQIRSKGCSVFSEIEIVRCD
jgi:hypothetical protein